MSNINDDFFDGHYKDIWKAFIPEVLTEKEIDFMIPYFKLGEGSKVLDLMCGYGRHALALGRKGIEVTAIDNLKEYTDEIVAVAKKEKLPVNVIQQGVLDYSGEGQYDLAICMGNSLQFFDKEDVASILISIESSLRSGGQLLINSWSIAEIAIKNFKESVSSQVGDLKFQVESSFHFSPARIEVKSVITAPDGDMEEKDSVDYIYSINEMEEMLSHAGLKLKEVYSIPGRKKFTIGEPRAYLVAVKE